MVISKITIQNNQLTINQNPAEQVNKYCYLSITLNNQLDNSNEVKIRI